MIITANEKIELEVLDMIALLPNCVHELCNIQRLYKRGFYHYRDTEQAVDDTFRNMIFGLATFVVDSHTVMTDDGFSYTKIVDSTIVTLTQRCLSDKWRESGPTAVDDTDEIKVSYIASDGTAFDTEDECIEYEEGLASLDFDCED